MTSYQKRLQEIKALREQLNALEKAYLVAIKYSDPTYRATM